MSEPFIGQIRWFPYTRVPRGYAVCDGSLLQISQYEALFTLLGTTYGGDGIATFAVPDLRGRLPVHQGQGPGLSLRSAGQKDGSETVTLTVAQMPAHVHYPNASTSAADTTAPAGALPAMLSPTQAMYVTNTNGTTSVALDPTVTGSAGGSQSHENCAPTLTILPCIALEGIYPSRQ